MFDFTSLFGGLGGFKTPDFNPNASPENDWLNQVAGLGKKGDPTADYLKSIGAGPGSPGMFAQLGKMAPYLSSVPQAQMSQAPMASAPRLNPGEVQSFAGMSPYQGLMKTKSRAVNFGGLL